VLNITRKIIKLLMISDLLRDNPWALRIKGGHILIIKPEKEDFLVPMRSILAENSNCKLVAPKTAKF